MAHKRSIDRLQNLTIALLTLSACLLTAFSVRLFYGSQDNRSSSAAVPAQQTSLSDLSMPLNFAVTGTYGCYGNLNVTTTSADFALPATLLREALGSAGNPVPCSAGDLVHALGGFCAYYDFGTAFPADVIAGLTGTELPGTLRDWSIRRCILSAGNGSVSLYVTDGANHRRCTTQVSADYLSDLADTYSLGTAAFAFELKADALDPLTLLPLEISGQYPVLNIRNPLEEQEALLTALSINPHTNSRYTDSGGTLVIQAGERTVRVAPNAEISYEDSSRSALTVKAAGQQPTAEEAVLGAFRLLDRLFPDSSALYPCEVLQDPDGSWRIAFDYQSDGMRIHRSSGLPAAQVHLQGNAVAEFSLLPRQYAVSGEQSLLLPLTQALAIADSLQGQELNICYTDNDSGQAYAGWLAQ